VLEELLSSVSMNEKRRSPSLGTAYKRANRFSETKKRARFGDSPSSALGVGVSLYIPSFGE